MRHLFCTTVLIVAHSLCISQSNVLIPENEKINLPINKAGEIEMSAEFDESKISSKDLKDLFIKEVELLFDSEEYFIVDTIGNTVEVFAMKNCDVFRLDKLSDKEIVTDGFVTSSLYFTLLDGSYDITIKEFKWIKSDESSHKISKIYSDFINEKSLKEKVKTYGVLKTTEILMTQTFETALIIVNDFVNLKSKGNIK